MRAREQEQGDIVPAPGPWPYLIAFQPTHELFFNSIFFSLKRLVTQKFSKFPIILRREETKTKSTITKKPYLMWRGYSQLRAECIKRGCIAWKQRLRATRQISKGQRVLPCMPPAGRAGASRSQFQLCHSCPQRRQASLVLEGAGACLRRCVNRSWETLLTVLQRRCLHCYGHRAGALLESQARHAAGEPQECAYMCMCTRTHTHPCSWEQAGGPSVNGAWL